MSQYLNVIYISVIYIPHPNIICFSDKVGPQYNILSDKVGRVFLTDAAGYFIWYTCDLRAQYSITLSRSTVQFHSGIYPKM